MANKPRKPKVSREDFKLYDVVDTCGPYAGCKNNAFPLSLGEAEALASATDRTWNRRVVRTSDRKWEDYCYAQRYLHRNKPLGPVSLPGGEEHRKRYRQADRKGE